MRLSIFRPATSWRVILWLELIAVVLVPPCARADDKALREQIESTKNSIAPFPKNFSNDPALKEKLGQLAKSIEDVSCDVFSDVIRCHLDRLGGTIALLNEAVTGRVLTDKTQKQLIREAIDSLINILENDPAANKPDATGKRDPKNNKPDLTKAATFVASILKDRLKGADLTDEDLQKALPALPKAPPKKFFISIHRALYGDLNDINRYLDGSYDQKAAVGAKTTPALIYSKTYSVPQPEATNDILSTDEVADDKRICSATQSMRTYCQGRAACWTVSDNSPTRTATYLCGYDPAPYAAPINKGLVVLYSCEGELDPTKEPKPPKKEDLRIARFRLSETAQITCAEPIEPASKAEAGK